MGTALARLRRVGDFRIPPVLGALLHGVLLLAALWGLYEVIQRLERPWPNDAFGFYTMWEGGLYDRPWLERYAFVYSPAFAQALAPVIDALSWPVFSDIWNMLQLAALVVMVGPIWAAGLIWLLPWPALPDGNAVYLALRNGNPMLLVALSVVAGHRWPAAWAAAILMKVTPGIGLLWFVVRREWRNLAIAAGATAGIALISLVLAPGLWLEWFGLLGTAARANTLANEPVLALPLLVRLPAAALLIAWGARADRYWTVPIGAMLALPAIQLGGFAVAVGALAFTRLPWIPRFWRQVR